MNDERISAASVGDVPDDRIDAAVRATGMFEIVEPNDVPQALKDKMFEEGREMVRRILAVVGPANTHPPDVTWPQGWYTHCREGNHHQCPVGQIDGHDDCACPCHADTHSVDALIRAAWAWRDSSRYGEPGERAKAAAFWAALDAVGRPVPSAERGES